MEKFVTIRHECRGCGSKKLIKFLDLGEMPLAGGFLREDEFESEKKIPLEVYLCEDCKLAQICHIVDPVVLFKNYFYISSVIKSLSEHFYEYSEFIKNRYLSNGGKILEMGCNDGVLLQYFKDNENIISLGIDASENVTKLAQDKGLNVINGFFGIKSASEIVKNHGQFDILTGSNMFAHIDDIIEIINGAKIVLNPNGVFIFEVHYLLDLLKEFQYDTIYHEHLTYYSVLAIQKIFSLQGMKVIEVQHLNMHGGGIRVITARQSSIHKVDTSVESFIKEEIEYGLDKTDTYLGIGKSITLHKEQLISVIQDIKKTGKSIVGYGAPGRGTILLNYCNIGNNYLDYIVDVSPLRQDMYMPGVHVHIKDPKVAHLNPPDYFLVLAWNYIDSILTQEKELLEKGTKFIVPFPIIKVI